MPKIISKNLLIKQGSVYGVKSQSKMTDDGVQLNAVTNLKNTQNNKKPRRKIVPNANLSNFDPNARLAIKEFEAWQRKVFKKNCKKGYRFFQPDSIDTPTPRSAREAWGGTYKHDDTDKRESRAQKIMFAIVVVVLLLLSTL
jgi:hypothetical protein